MDHECEKKSNIIIGNSGSHLGEWDVRQGKSGWLVKIGYFETRGGKSFITLTTPFCPSCGKKFSLENPSPDDK